MQQESAVLTSKGGRGERVACPNRALYERELYLRMIDIMAERLSSGMVLMSRRPQHLLVVHS
jgi:hypothetical protein